MESLNDLYAYDSAIYYMDRLNIPTLMVNA
jgi:hypothetical protein